MIKLHSLKKEFKVLFGSIENTVFNLLFDYFGESVLKIVMEIGEKILFLYFEAELFHEI